MVYSVVVMVEFLIVWVGVGVVEFGFFSGKSEVDDEVCGFVVIRVCEGMVCGCFCYCVIVGIG